MHYLMKTTCILLCVFAVLHTSAGVSCKFGDNEYEAGDEVPGYSEDASEQCFCRVKAGKASVECMFKEDEPMFRTLPTKKCSYKGVEYEDGDAVPDYPNKEGSCYCKVQRNKALIDCSKGETICQHLRVK
ncbi:uncharacterized protein LOC131940814 [Physella acuta]|uniref:uncharacterized protein LOC131940814 n=1 Tax=Physella acuta TaxID=109671 RepID=UPI0027DE82FB|nr:uncharacterized protein LOC131940814 [Physella acuta]